MDAEAMKKILEDMIGLEVEQLLHDVYRRGFNAGFIVGFCCALCGGMIFLWTR